MYVVVSWFSLSVLRLVVDYMTSSQRFAWQVLVSLGWECKNDPPHTVGPQTIKTTLISLSVLRLVVDYMTSSQRFALF